MRKILSKYIHRIFDHIQIGLLRLVPDIMGWNISRPNYVVNILNYAFQNKNLFKIILIWETNIMNFADVVKHRFHCASWSITFTCNVEKI